MEAGSLYPSGWTKGQVHVVISSVGTMMWIRLVNQGSSHVWGFERMQKGHDIGATQGC